MKTKVEYLSTKNPSTLKRAKKCYALVSFAHAMIVDAKLSTLKINALLRQTKLSMQGYHKAVGTYIYMESTEEFAEIYISLNSKYSTRVSSTESAVFIELLLNLVPKKDMKEFILMIYNSGYSLDASRMDELVDIALAMDDELNNVIGSLKTASKDSLLDVFKPKPIKTKTPKIKTKSKKQLAHDREVEEARLAKERKKVNLATIRKIAEQARKRVCDE